DQEYVVILNQAKLSVSNTTSHTDSIDGSTQDQILTVVYGYDSRGRLTGAKGIGSFTSKDEWSTTTGSIEQDYAVVLGQAKLSVSKTTSHTDSLDGSKQDQTLIVTYHYNEKTGRVTGAHGSGTFTSEDEWSQTSGT